MEYRVDHVASVERAADGIHCVPYADEADPNDTGNTVSFPEILHRIGIRAAQAQSNQNPVEEATEPSSIRPSVGAIGLPDRLAHGIRSQQLVAVEDSALGDQAR